MNYFYQILLIASVLTPFCLLNGITNHMLIARRSLQLLEYFPAYKKYAEILRKHRAFMEAGSGFPDWGYICKNENAAETAHWEPFGYEYAKYIKNTYKFGTEQFEKNLAFLFGVMSHSYADMGWHWGVSLHGKDGGFIPTMSHADSYANDTFQTSHVLEVGAEGYIAYRDARIINLPAWNIPKEDIYHVYNKLNISINKLSMAVCLFAMKVETRALKYIGRELFEYMYQKKTSFIEEELDLWFSGGFHDTAINTVWKWMWMVDYLENKTTINVPINVQYLKKKTNFLTELKKVFKNLPKQVIAYIKFKLSAIKESVSEPPEEENATAIQKSKTVKPYHSTPGSVESEYFGFSLTAGDFKKSGEKQFLASGPLYSEENAIELGAIYDIGKELEGAPLKPFLKGENKNGRFGFATTVADLNHDGIDDLIVSAPTYGKGGPSKLEDRYPRTNEGRVYVYFGKKDIGLSEKPDLTLKMRDESADPYMNLGYKLFSGDCNNDGFKDLIIGSPFANLREGYQNGHVAIFLGLKDEGNKFIEDADWVLKGEKNYSWFGFAADCGNNKVFIGAPGERPEAGPHKQAVGAVHFFDLEKRVEIHKLMAEEDREKYGFSLSYLPNKDLLAVSAPTYSINKLSGGAVFTYDLHKQPYPKSPKEYKAIFTSGKRGERLGYNIAWAGNTLIISAPFYTGGIIFKAASYEQGRILAFENGADKTGTIQEKQAALIFEQGKIGRLGSNILVGSNKVLIASAPFAKNGDSILEGRVDYFKLP